MCIHLHDGQELARYVGHVEFLAQSHYTEDHEKVRVRLSMM